MYIVTVIPLLKNQQKEYLSYFSTFDIEPGTIVSIPIRKKEVDAIVINTENAINIKSEIKNADYQLRKITKIKGPSPFNNSFFETCKKMKDYTISSTGSIIRTMFPGVFLNNIDKLKKLISKNDTHNIKQDENIKSEKLVFQNTLADRLAFYRTLVREAFAKKESVYLCIPTKYDAEYFTKELSKGIEQYVFTFYSDLPNKQLIDNYNKCVENTHPIIIIGTGVFLSIPRNDIKTIIIENESSEAYKQITRPYLDIRSFVELLSSTQKIKLILGDTILRPETLYRHDIGELGEVSSPLYRISQTENQMMIDMKSENEQNDKKVFSIISKQTKTLIDKALSSSSSAFLFTTRKGLAPITVCNDCGYTILCPDCMIPIVLYGSKQITANKSTTRRIFMCNKCGKKQETEISCPKCGSWNLNPLGIGTDKVYEEIKKIYPNTKIFQIDKEATPTQKEINQTIRDFEKSSGSILIGTEMALFQMKEKVEVSVIISLDGLLAIPSFNMTQKIIHLIDRLENTTNNKLIIQTRNFENKILKYISSGNVLSLCRDDLNERRIFGYPPFKRLIKITFEGKASDTEKARSLIENILNTYDPQIFSAFKSKTKGEYITNTVIKLDPKNWPLISNNTKKLDENLYRNLSGLPPSFSVNVDPEDLL